MSLQNNSAFLRQAAEEIRSITKHAPEIADEMQELADDLDGEAERQVEAALRRRDFTLSTRRLSARLATGS